VAAMAGAWRGLRAARAAVDAAREAAADAARRRAELAQQVEETGQAGQEDNGDLVGADGLIDLGGIISRALQMGDEMHNRHRAATSLLFRELALRGLATESLRFIDGNDYFFLNLVMAAAKAACEAAAGVPRSTLVVTMARNGTEFGVRVSGDPERWFTAPAAVPVGLFLGGYTQEDANPDIGDSAITETAGLGGFAMAGAPAIVRFVGGTVSDALRTTRTELEEANRRLSVERASLSSLGRIEGEARVRLGMVAASQQQVQLAREFAAPSAASTARLSERTARVAPAVGLQERVR